MNSGAFTLRLTTWLLVGLLLGFFAWDGRNSYTPSSQAVEEAREHFFSND